MAKRDRKMEEGEGVLEESAEARVYELGFHLDPELPIEEVKKAYGAVRDAIAAAGAIVAEGEPQKIPLAYTISRQEPAGRRDFSSAYFCWIAYEAPVSAHTEVLARAGADTHIIRFIDLVTTKEAARHAAEMREVLVRTPERTKTKEAADAAPEPEVALGAELDAALERVEV